jgi:hypothetical protein
VDTELVAATERSAIKNFEMYLLKRRPLLCSENLIDVFVDGQMVADVLVQTKDEEPPLGVGLLAHFEDIENMARIVSVLRPARASAGVAAPGPSYPDGFLGQDITVDLVAQLYGKTEEGRIKAIAEGAGEC